ncbi:Uncharacterised protein [Legionella pneumophila]|uniref:hypothetical protein n=1 Tax=Legionella pneumophila TaxID=446 RepID=UPI000DFD1BAD|nr:hypothetical protein [Legionella pneumophila]STX68099.1 Uncharacterised protein [Legionella pneumophila]
MHSSFEFYSKKAQRFCRFVGEKGSLYWDLLENSVSLVKDREETFIYKEPDWDKIICIS